MDDYKSFLDEGIYNIQQGAYEEAVKVISKSIELKNDFDVSYFYRAVCHQALENYDEAMMDYTESIRLNPKMTDAYYNRANIILTRKDIENPKLENALKDLTKALELDPDFVDALYAMGALKKKLGEYEEAIKYLNKVIEIEPDAVHAKALKKLILTKYLNG